MKEPLHRTYSFLGSWLIVGLLFLGETRAFIFPRQPYECFVYCASRGGGTSFSFPKLGSVIFQKTRNLKDIKCFCKSYLSDFLPSTHILAGSKPAVAFPVMNGEVYTTAGNGGIAVSGGGGAGMGGEGAVGGMGGGMGGGGAFQSIPVQNVAFQGIPVQSVPVQSIPAQGGVAGAGMGGGAGSTFVRGEAVLEQPPPVTTCKPEVQVKCTTRHQPPNLRVTMNPPVTPPEQVLVPVAPSPPPVAFHVPPPPPQQMVQIPATSFVPAEEQIQIPVTQGQARLAIVEGGAGGMGVAMGGMGGGSGFGVVSEGDAGGMGVAGGGMGVAGGEGGLAVGGGIPVQITRQQYVEQPAAQVQQVPVQVVAPVAEQRMVVQRAAPVQQVQMQAVPVQQVQMQAVPQLQVQMPVPAAPPQMVATAVQMVGEAGDVVMGGGGMLGGQFCVCPEGGDVLSGLGAELIGKKVAGVLGGGILGGQCLDLNAFGANIAPVLMQQVGALEGQCVDWDLARKGLYNMGLCVC